MPIGVGSDSSIRVKEEATPGTKPATGFFQVPVTGFELIPRVGSRTKSATLGALAKAIPYAFRSPLLVEGFAETEGDYNGAFDWMLNLHLGGQATTGGGADPYTNTYTPVATPPTGHIEHIAGNKPSGKCLRYQQVVVPELVISGSAKGKLTARATLVAEKEASVDPGGDTPTATGLVTPVGVPIQPQQASVWNVGVGTDTQYCVTDFTITSRRPLAEPEACFGSAFYLPAAFASALELEYEFRVGWEDLLSYEQCKGGDVLTTIRLNFLGAAVLTGFYTLDIRVTRSDLDQAGPPKWDTNGRLFNIIKGTGYGVAGSGQTSEPWNVRTINLIDGAAI